MNLGFPPLPELPGYVFEKVVKKGDFHQMVLARQVALDRTVGVVFLLRRESSFSLGLFYSELQKAARVHHGSFTRIVDGGETKHYFYWIRECRRSFSLPKRISSEKFLRQLTLEFLGLLQSFEMVQFCHTFLGRETIYWDEEKGLSVEDPLLWKGGTREFQETFSHRPFLELPLSFEEIDRVEIAAFLIQLALGEWGIQKREELFKKLKKLSLSSSLLQTWEALLYPEKGGKKISRLQEELGTPPIQEEGQATWCFDTPREKQKPRILIVDDEPESTLWIRDYLEEKGFETEFFENPEIALKDLEKNQADLVILDIHFPGANGIEVGEKIQKRWGLPLIFITSYPAKEKAVEAAKLGADFLEKPIRPKVLLARVERLLKKGGKP